MTEQHKALVRRYFTEVLNKGRYALIKELFAPSFLFSGPEHTRPVPGMTEGLYEFVANMRHAFPDLFVSLENVIAEGDQVVAVWRMTGTFTEAFNGVPPTQKLCSITGIDIFTIEHGRIEGMWAFSEMRSLLEQLPAGRRRTQRKRRTAAAPKRTASAPKRSRK